MCLMNLVSFSLKTRAPDHILDDERSPLRELDLLVKAASARDDARAWLGSIHSTKPNRIQATQDA